MHDVAKARPEGRAREVFAAFLLLGLTSFGGPIAHLGYFRRELVERRRWLSEIAYADLIGLCQFLPGPTSSQAGFALGLMRAGPLGGLAAWTAFTLPSALLLLLFATAAQHLSGPLGDTILHGLKLVAVPIVAQAVIGMARTLTPDLRRATIAVAVGLLVSTITVPWMQIVAITSGAAAGLLICHGTIIDPAASIGWLPSRRAGAMHLLAFIVLLVAALTLASGAHPRIISLGAIFFRAGALVFGGGHVVLPLLRSTMVPHWIDDGSFLAGYGAAQALPGPLFTFAAYLGAKVAGVGGAAVALPCIFLPGLLLIAGLLPFRRTIRTNPAVQRALAGVNAAVVGILAAALYNPLWSTGVRSIGDASIAAAGVLLLLVWRVVPLLVVGLTVAGVVALSWFGWA